MLKSIAFAAALMWGVAAAAAAPAVEVWKSSDCTCCEGWVAHMRANGSEVTVHDVDDVAPIKAANGITDALISCHTARVEGYVVEGHVPAEDIARLVAERPAVRGIAAPGMPLGAPGMDGGSEAYDVLSFAADGTTAVFAHH